MPRINRRPRGGPSAPHRFAEPEDPRMGLALAAGSTAVGGWNQGAIPVADATLRQPRCTLCGKPREDAIHLPPD